MNWLLAAAVWPKVVPWVAGGLGVTLLFFGLNGHVRLARLLRGGRSAPARKPALKVDPEAAERLRKAKGEAAEQAREHAREDLEQELAAERALAAQARAAREEADLEADEARIEGFSALSDLLASAKEKRLQGDAPAHDSLLVISEPVPYLPSGLVALLVDLRKGRDSAGYHERLEQLKRSLELSETLLGLLERAGGDLALKPELKAAWEDALSELSDLERNLALKPTPREGTA